MVGAVLRLTAGAASQLLTTQRDGCPNGPFQPLMQLLGADVPLECSLEWQIFMLSDGDQYVLAVNLTQQPLEEYSIVQLRGWRFAMRNGLSMGEVTDMAQPGRAAAGT